MNSLPPTLESIATRVTALEGTAKENHESHGKIYERLDILEKGHAVLDTSLNNIWTVLKEIQADVKEMKERPGKRYDRVVEIVVQWLIVGILGAAVIFK